MTNKIECTFTFITIALGLPDECKLVGLKPTDYGTVVFEVEVPGLPENTEPVFTAHSTLRDQLPERLFHITGHWRHEPDVEWDTHRFLSFS